MNETIIDLIRVDNGSLSRIRHTPFGAKLEFLNSTNR